jgi:hypothetical protein
MKKFGLVVCGLLVCIGSTITVPATATVLDFEDAYTGNALTLYRGFTWKNIYGFPGTYMPGTGYFNGITSGKNVAFNGDANDGEGAKTGSFWTTDGEFFSLQSINVTKAWHSGTTRFVGYVDGNPILTKDVFSSTLAPTHAVFNWHGLTRIDIVDLDKSMQSVFDDIRLNEVPEPAPLSILFAGLAALMFSRRQQKHIS